MFEFLRASIASRCRADESSRLCVIEVPGPEVRAVAASTQPAKPLAVIKWNRDRSDSVTVAPAPCGAAIRLGLAELQSPSLPVPVLPQSLSVAVAQMIRATILPVPGADLQGPGRLLTS
jgi:hypothetical protein